MVLKLSLALAGAVLSTVALSLPSALAQSGSAAQTEPVSTSSDWLNWRGPSQNGSSTQTNLPRALSPKELQWKVALPGTGCSTPITVAGLVYLTAPEEGKDTILCIDAMGKEKWATRFGKENPGRHRNGSGSNASPVSDGLGVFAYFKSGTLAAVELDGSKRWNIDLVKEFGPAKMYWSHGTSPVLTEKYVIMARICEGGSWLAAFDKQTGKLAWKVDRNYKTPKEGDQGYATPMVIDHAGVESILVWGAEHLTLHNASDGKVTWSCGGFNLKKVKLWPSVASPVLVGDMIVVPSGRNDKRKPILHGVKMAGEGDQTETAHQWMREDASTFVPTPCVRDKQIYMVRDQGQVECFDPKTGETIWEGKLPKSRSKFYSSPLMADGMIYAPREDGVVFTIKVGDGKFELGSTNDLGESVIGSPIVLGNRVIVRGEKHLFCFGAAE